MNKYIFITNGSGGCGKDTFAEFVGELVPTIKHSSIDKVKAIARMCGWNGGKTEIDRKFLSDLKLLTSEYSDMPFTDIHTKIKKFMYIDEEHEVCLIDIREPEEIAKIVKTCPYVKTILITSNRVPVITSNMADANVGNYDYDFVIRNDGTLDDFRKTVYKFVEENIKKEND